MPLILAFGALGIPSSMKIIHVSCLCRQPRRHPRPLSRTRILHFLLLLPLTCTAQRTAPAPHPRTHGSFLHRIQRRRRTRPRRCPGLTPIPHKTRSSLPMSMSRLLTMLRRRRRLMTVSRPLNIKPPRMIIPRDESWPDPPIGHPPEIRTPLFGLLALQVAEFLP